MHIRVIIAVFLLLSVLVGGIFLSLHMDDFCDELLALVGEAKENIGTQGSDNGQAFSKAKKLWDDKLPFVCSFVIHDQVDSVSQAFFKAEGFLSSETWDEYLSCLGELTILLDMIKNYDKPTVRSIL